MITFQSLAAGYTEIVQLEAKKKQKQKQKKHIFVNNCSDKIDS